MPIGARCRVNEVGRVGDDQVEQAWHAAQQVTQHRRDRDPGKRRVRRGQAQGDRVDVDGEHLRLRMSPRDQDRPRAGAAANVHRTPHRLVQHPRDGLAEAVGVGAKEHRVRRRGRKGGVEEQQPLEGRQPHGAPPQPAIASDKNIRLGHRAKDLGRDVRLIERLAPTEHAAQVTRTRHARAREHPRMCGRRRGYEMIPCRLHQPCKSCELHRVRRAYRVQHRGK